MASFTLLQGAITTFKRIALNSICVSLFFFRDIQNNSNDDNLLRGLGEMLRKKDSVLRGWCWLWESIPWRRLKCETSLGMFETKIEFPLWVAIILALACWCHSKPPPPRTINIFSVEEAWANREKWSKSLPRGNLLPIYSLSFSNKANRPFSGRMFALRVSWTVKRTYRPMAVWCVWRPLRTWWMDRVKWIIFNECGDGETLVCDGGPLFLNGEPNPEVNAHWQY